MRLRSIVAVAFCALVTGCTTTKLNPELVAAATPSTSTPATIAGDIASPCLAAKTFIKGVIVGQEGTYSPGMTYVFAEKMRRAGKDGALYAPLVRAYAFRKGGVGYFGAKIDGQFACYYELKDGRLRYLATLNGDHEGRVDRNRMGDAILQAYMAMSGKSRSEIFFGG